MRYFLADGPPPALAELQAALSAAESSGLLTTDPSEPERGDLYFSDVLYAEIEVNTPGDEIFDEDRDELLDELGKQDDPKAREAAQALANATGAVVFRVYEPGHDDWPRLSVLVNWLLDTRDGVLQVDEEGIFDRSGRKIVALL